jgi:hypothetical protein
MALSVGQRVTLLRIDAIRQHIEQKAVSPVHEQAKAKILVSRAPRTTCDDSETALLYPEIEAHHAVVDRMKEAIV